MRKENTNVTQLKASDIETQKPKRYYYLDNLKIALTCLVVAHHTSQAYIDRDTGWPIHQDNIPELTNKIIGMFLDVNSSFFMALFFMISAYFIPNSLDRKPIPVFLKDRIKRFGVPIVIITLVVFPILGFALNGSGMSFTEFLTNRYFNITDGEINLGQTWFIFALLIFSCVYALYVKIVRGISKVSTVHTKSDQLGNVPSNLQILIFTVVLTLSTFLIRLFFYPGYWLPLHIFEPAQSFTYISIFIIGIIASRNQWLDKARTSIGVTWGVVSIVLILLAPLITQLYLKHDEMRAIGLSLQALTVTAWEMTLCVGLCVSLPVLFRQKLNFTNRLLKTAARNSFSVYLVHPFVIIPFQVLFLSVPLPPAIKAILVSGLAIVLSYSLCQLYTKVKSLIFKGHKS